MFFSVSEFVIVSSIREFVSPFQNNGHQKLRTLQLQFLGFHGSEVLQLNVSVRKTSVRTIFLPWVSRSGLYHSLISQTRNKKVILSKYPEVFSKINVPKSSRKFSIISCNSTLTLWKLIISNITLKKNQRGLNYQSLNWPPCQYLLYVAKGFPQRIHRYWSLSHNSF